MTMIRVAWLVENAVRKSVHDPAPNGLEIDGSEKRKCRKMREVCIDGGHEFDAEALPIIFKLVEDGLKISVGSQKELDRETHREVRMRFLTSSQATTSWGCSLR